MSLTRLASALIITALLVLFPVRPASSQVPSGSLVVNGDGSVTDSEHGLMWQADTSQNPGWLNRTSPITTGVCEHLTLAGKRDWRLPTLSELLQLSDNNAPQGCKWRYGISGQCSSYWTSNRAKCPGSDANNSFYACNATVNFTDGSVGSGVLIGSDAVERCVRDIALAATAAFDASSGGIDPHDTSIIDGRIGGIALYAPAAKYFSVFEHSIQAMDVNLYKVDVQRICPLDGEPVEVNVLELTVPQNIVLDGWFPGSPFARWVLDARKQYISIDEPNSSSLLIVSDVKLLVYGGKIVAIEATAGLPKNFSYDAFISALQEKFGATAARTGDGARIAHGDIEVLIGKEVRATTPARRDIVACGVTIRSIEAFSEKAELSRIALENIKEKIADESARAMEEGAMKFFKISRSAVPKPKF